MKQLYDGSGEGLDIKFFWEQKTDQDQGGTRDCFFSFSQFSEEPSIYHISFKVEQIVELGGAIVNGVLVPSQNEYQFF